MADPIQPDIEATQETYDRPSQASQQQMADINAQADKLIELLEKVSEGDQVADIVTNGIKLLRDSTGRGDMKLISKAVSELRYALKIFEPYRDTHKISVFGSARTHPDEPDYKAAVEFGRKMADKGWMVTTGAGGGIMAAALGGAGRDPSFGLAIRLPFEQQTNEHIEGDKKLVNFKYFFTRKLMFVRTSQALAAFPGGFGTMDELFEVLTLIQTGKAPIMPIVMVDKKGGKFWTRWQEYVEEQLLGRKLISATDRNLYMITEDVDAAVDEVVKFYRNYHSMRYVKNQAVIRLKVAPNAQALSEIEKRFADIKVSGTFTVSSALKAEADETAIAHLPRLVFDFNRKDLGRLRELIDFLNTLQ
ncbi:MAG TPA: TIGR00730 family Rossman fold protein [Tepidisphaeraceae bacterium]|nr:TIGR00730 family Rossman fold protein [Tepidisphaeraceae bacterium]